MKRALILGLAAILAATAVPARATDFDNASWQALGCNAADLVANTSPGSVDFVGDANTPAAYVAWDATDLYFRFRVDSDPQGAGGFDQYVWTALMQVPSGNPFQYQYQLSLNGKDETIEIWENTNAQDIDFSPIFQDDSEVRRYQEPRGSSARRIQVGNDWFVDFAFPVAALVNAGAITGSADIANALFFPATSTTPNSYNKGHLNCPFLPGTNLTITNEVTPSTPLPANTTTETTFTVTVTNEGGFARGIEITNPTPCSLVGDVQVLATSDDATVVLEVVSTNPLVVRAPHLPAGASIIVTITGQATPSCSDTGCTSVATVSAVNAFETSAQASLGVEKNPNATELCDGVDNDCDGTTDEGTDAVCSDGEPCNGSETCGGASGCQAGTTPSCGDGNACTTDACTPGVGCESTTIPGCVPCDDAGDCNDGQACTTDACVAGACANTTIPGCVPCTTEAECGDGSGCTTDTCDAGACAHAVIPGCVSCASATDCGDGDPCSNDSCSAEGVCGHSARPGCVPCTTVSDCDDSNACTADVCQADGSCGHVTIPGCVPCDTDADCGDADECTTDTCSAGACTHPQAEACACTPTTEICGDDVDNDCDGTLDCADENCVSAPGCAAPAEVCGDCFDNDNDGLVDYEDSDCCSEAMPLGLRKLTLKTNAPRTKRNALRMKSKSVRGSRAPFDPTRQDTSLQIADGSGQVFCATVSAKNWKKKGRTVRFRDKKRAFAGGLGKGLFKVKKDGRIVFRAKGRKMTLRTPAPQLDVTLRVGGACWQTPVTLKKHRKSMRLS